MTRTGRETDRNRRETNQQGRNRTVAPPSENERAVAVRERACILHFDGGVQWEEAERRAEAEHAAEQGGLFA